MKQRKIIIGENGNVSMPNNVQMADFEIAELFGVILPTIRANIRAILKTGIATADLTGGATMVGNNVLPDYHGLDMVIALAFRIQSFEAKLFRQWVIQRCVAHRVQPIVLQYNYAQTHLSEQN